MTTMTIIRQGITLWLTFSSYHSYALSYMWDVQHEFETITSSWETAAGGGGNRVECAAVQAESLESSWIPRLGRPLSQGDTVMAQLIILLASRLVIESSLDSFVWAHCTCRFISFSYCLESKQILRIGNVKSNCPILLIITHEYCRCDMFSIQREKSLYLELYALFAALTVGLYESIILVLPVILFLSTFHIC